MQHYQCAFRNHSAERCPWGFPFYRKFTCPERKRSSFLTVVISAVGSSSIQASFILNCGFRQPQKGNKIETTVRTCYSYFESSTAQSYTLLPIPWTTPCTCCHDTTQKTNPRTMRTCKARLLTEHVASLGVRIGKGARTIISRTCDAAWKLRTCKGTPERWMRGSIMMVQTTCLAIHVYCSSLLQWRTSRHKGNIANGGRIGWDVDAF